MAVIMTSLNFLAAHARDRTKGFATLESSKINVMFIQELFFVLQVGHSAKTDFGQNTVTSITLLKFH